jgi:hypothetical protein
MCILGSCGSMSRGDFMCWVLRDWGILKLFLCHGVVGLQLSVPGSTVPH